MANKPILHRRDHEHGGADTVRIVYESVGGGVGGSSYFSLFGSYDFNAFHTHPAELKPGTLTTSDPATFDTTAGGQVRILAPGGYMLFATMHISGSIIEDDGAFYELNFVAVTTDTGLEFGSTQGDVPVGGVVTYPFFGGGGATPSAQNFTFVIVDEAWLPSTIEIWADWTFANDYSGWFTLAGFKV